jgi:hypothetical protein
MRKNQPQNNLKKSIGQAACLSQIIEARNSSHFELPHFLRTTIRPPVPARCDGAILLRRPPPLSKALRRTGKHYGGWNSAAGGMPENSPEIHLWVLQSAHGPSTARDERNGIRTVNVFIYKQRRLNQL